MRLAPLLFDLSQAAVIPQADHHLCVLLNIARVFQLVPLMRMLLPLSCILLPETCRQNEDVSQELAFLQVSWQHVAYFKRQPYRILQDAQLQEVGETGKDGPKLPKLNEGCVMERKITWHKGIFIMCQVWVWKLRQVMWCFPFAAGRSFGKWR